jgi:hypothetical protein
MKSIDEVEQLLVETRVPCLQEGSHRQQLKERLLAERLSITPGEKKVSKSLFAHMSPAVKTAAAIMAAALLVGVGWAAEKIVEKLKFTQAAVVLEERPQREWTLPEGKKLATSVTAVTVVNPDDPNAVATVQRHHQEMKDLIAQKKYELVKTFEDQSTGMTQYVYRFTLSDGTQDAMNFSMPLDGVASWDDYQKRAQEQREHFQEQINNAIAAGNYRLINQDVFLLHICRDAASQEKFRVQRISLTKGDEVALYHAFDVSLKKQAITKPQSTWREHGQSSWQEHLQAIRDGKLELLEVETLPNYTYEMTCDDGVKRIFNYGGGEPLRREKGE